jgi:hypothetical protein
MLAALPYMLLDRYLIRRLHVVFKINVDIGYILMPKCDKCIIVFWVCVDKWNKLPTFNDISTSHLIFMALGLLYIEHPSYVKFKKIQWQITELLKAASLTVCVSSFVLSQRCF